MGSRTRLLIGFLLCAAGPVLSSRAHALDLFWFGDGVNLGGTGNWSAVAMTWSTTTPAPTLTVWNPARTGVFQGSAGTVTVTDANIDAGAGLRFETDLYTVAGGSVTLTGASPPANPLSVSAAATATSNAAIAGANGLSKVGAGTLVLAATNTYTGETWIEGGTLRVTGSVNTGDNAFVGYNNGMTNLSILGGGSLMSANGYMANLPTSSNNMATVSGTGSSWTNATDLAIGHQGATNALTVLAGGAVSTTNGFLGYFSTSSSNAVLVTGMDSQWSNSNVLEIGHDGSGNTFSVEDGGTALSSKDVVIGFNASSASNALKVKDTGSKFEVATGFTLVIGDNGDTNSLEITNGGVVMGHNARLARNASSSNNTVTVMGVGSKWTNTGTIRVGTLGPGNSVMVSAGGEVSFAGNQFIGHGLAAANNTVTVTGAGSKWTGGNLVVGLASTGNVFTVSDGASAMLSGVAIANDPGSEGTVNIGAGAAAGAFNAPIQFGDGTGILNFNHTDPAYAFNNPIVGPGAVRHIGSGTTIIFGPSTYSGGTTLSAGVMRLGADNALPNTGPFIFNGGTLDADNKSANLGVLTLQATSTLNFGPGSDGEDVVFASAAPYVGGTLLVTGIRFVNDRLIITADPTASGILDHIQFSGYAIGAIWKPSTGEVLPRFGRIAAAPVLSPVGVAFAVGLLAAFGAWSLARRRGAVRRVLAG